MFRNIKGFVKYVWGEFYIDKKEDVYKWVGKLFCYIILFNFYIFLVNKFNIMFLKLLVGF